MGPFAKKDQSRRYRRQGGFTLIEVMVAMAYLTVGLLAIARNVDARRLTFATNLAGEMVDRIRYNSPTSLVRQVGAPNVTNPFPYHNIIACTPALYVVPAITCPLGVVTTCPASFNGVCTGPTPGNAVLNLSAANQNRVAMGDFAQWTAGLAARDPNGISLLPNARGWVTVAQVDPADLNNRKPLLVTVSVSWSAGVRTPTVVMNTIVAPL
jgi:prepilin-type N-terminal cleavage/methylation domain-containing protein